MSNKLTKTCKIIFLIVLIMFIGIIGINKVTQNDLFFDLKTGESLLKYGLDFKDHFSFIPNLVYMYHHYLYDIIMYYLFKFLGYMGVFLFFYIIFIIIAFVILKENIKNTKSTFISVFITLFSIFLSIGYITNRVQSITYLLFFLEVLLLEELYLYGKFKIMILLIIISILIANLHMPLWIFTLILFLPFLVEALLYLVLHKCKIFEKIKIIKLDKPWSYIKLFGTFIIVSFTGLFTPLKLYPYTFFTKALGNSSFSFINEMEKTTLKNEPMLFMVMFVTIVIFSFLIIYKNKINMRNFCLVIGLLLFGLIVRRNTVYAYLIIPTILFKMFFMYSDVPLALNEIKWLFKDRNKITYIVLSIGFIIGGSIYVLYHDIKNFDYGVSKNYPVEIVKYLKENTDYKNIILYNEFNYGSYLLYNDIPVFIDSRAEVYIKEFNGGVDVVGDYLGIVDTPSCYKIVNKYNFTHVLTSSGSTVDFCMINHPNYEVLKREKKKDVEFALYGLKNNI